MKIEVITTGSEIISGLTQDTNFRWLADRLCSLNFDLRYHTSVGDDRDDIVLALRTAYLRARAVIVTGGLGVTEDDITTECAADFFGVERELNPEALESIRERFRVQGRELQKIHECMALLPMGARVIPNAYGSAPGFSYEHAGVVFFFLPGVPRELRPMVEDYVIPELEKRSGGRRKYVTRLVRTYGLRESEIAQRLSGLERKGVRLGYRAHFPEVHLRVSAEGRTVEEAQALAEGFIGEITSRLGRAVFSTTGEELEEVVGKLLLERGMTLALAESCTGGLVAHRITNVPGSSNYFERGVVSYSNEAKIENLSVPRELIVEHGAVSAPVVERMASGVRELAGTDIGVGISGIAGPGGGTPVKPVGTVFIGLSHTRAGTHSHKFLFHGTRGEIKLLSSQTALDIIRNFLLNGV